MKKQTKEVPTTARKKEKVVLVSAKCVVCGFETKADLRKNGCPQCGHSGLRVQ